MNTTPSLLRLPAVQAKTGMGRSSIYQKIKEGTFPEPVVLGLHSVAWVEHEIDEWIEKQMRLREDGSWRKRKSPNPNAPEKVPVESKA